MISRILLALALATRGYAQSSNYDALVALFKDWRDFQKPPRVGLAYDYRAATMAAQKTGLARYQARLKAIDPRNWPIPQQVDYHIVRAEMNGLGFDHRVLKPWANNPGFYVTVFDDESDQPAREGPHAYGTVELFRYKRPFSPPDAAAIDSA